MTFVCGVLEINFFIIIKTMKSQKKLNSTVPSSAGKDTRLSGPHLGGHSQF